MERTVERRSRPDRAKATTVTAGIIMAEIHGRVAAAQFLQNQGVRFSTIVRVLGTPDRRRPTVVFGTPPSSTPVP